MLALDNTNASSHPRYQLENEYQDPFTKLIRNIRVRTTREDPSGDITLDGVAFINNIMLENTQIIEETLRPQLCAISGREHPIRFGNNNKTSRIRISKIGNGDRPT